MSVGLFALLKDVSLMAKAAVASLDDVATASLKATSKAAGVVIDDAAATSSSEAAAALAINDTSLSNANSPTDIVLPLLNPN